MLGKALAHFLGSKTYWFLLVCVVVGFLAAIGAAVFGESIWKEFLLFLAGESGYGFGRAAIVDGAPKVAAAWRDPNSKAANPPSATLAPISDIDALYGQQGEQT